MERRFEIRKRELLAECEVDPAVFEGAAERLAEFAEPFLGWLGRREQKEYAQIYLAGLVSDVETKNVESIAYLHDNERHRLQAFVGVSKWEHQPLLDELAIQVGQEIGEADAVIVFDPSGFPCPSGEGEKSAAPGARRLSPAGRTAASHHQRQIAAGTGCAR